MSDEKGYFIGFLVIRLMIIPFLIGAWNVVVKNLLPRFIMWLMNGRFQVPVLRMLPRKSVVWLVDNGWFDEDDTITGGELNRKQLFVLLCVAAWVSYVGNDLYSNWQPSWHEAILGLFIVRSIPALTFGTVLYRWWR